MASLTELRGAVSQDDPESCYQLADALRGAGSGEALQWYALAANQGHAGANYRLAVHYRDLDEHDMVGPHLAVAEESGFEAPEEDRAAWKAAGYLSFFTEEEALAALEQGVRQGNNEARFSLANRLIDGRDPLRAIALYREAARHGHAGAMSAMGRCHMAGTVVDANVEEAEKWLTRAVEQDDANGLFGLASIYLTRGKLADARQLFARAAAQQHEGAINQLNALDSRDTPEDAEAQYQKGIFFSDEEDDQDLELAVFWFGRAARQGHPDAMFMLARMIEGEEGPVRGTAQSELWYRKAAAAGHERARAEAAQKPAPAPGMLDMAIAGDKRSQYQLGFSHFMGTGAPQDYVQSYFWFRVLSATMPAQAQQMLQLLEAKLDAETRAGLDQLADQWLPGIAPPATPSPQIDRLRAAVSFDDPPACYELGKALAALGSTDANTEALEWYVWAAKEGYAPAHFALAVHYQQIGEEMEMEMHLHSARGHQTPADLLEAGAAAGIARFQYELGGQAAQRNDGPRALELYRAAAGKGYVVAMAKVGACYLNGFGVERDVHLAEQWFQQGVGHEDSEALFAMGAIRRNRGLAETRAGNESAAHSDFVTAADFFKRAAAKGHLTALYLLALAHRYGEGVEENQEAFRQLILAAAEKGHAQSQNAVAQMYAEGEEPFPQDDAEAVQWYTRAADLQHAGATFRLAAHVLYGRGTDRDFERGWDLTEKAAGMGDLDAMLALGAMIESGDGPEDDPEVALQWYTRAAEAGNAEAQYRSGKKLVENGELKDGLYYLQQAAGQGHAEAKALSESVGDRQPPAAPVSAAAAWSNDPAAASIAGDTNAQFQLGFAHYSGLGVPQSFRLSYFWLKIVERTMAPAVQQMLQMIAAQLGDQREELDRLAAAWTPGTPPPPA